MSGQQQTSGAPIDFRERADRLEYAFHYWATNYPASFSAVAPELLLDAVKLDLVERDKLESWLDNDLPQEDFQVKLNELKRKEDFSPKKIDYARYGEKKRAWLDILNERFIEQEKIDESGTDHRRWGRPVRDQFIILGIIASEPNGIHQGRLVQCLGIPVNEEASRRYAANMVRAAKIALSRLADKAGVEGGLFKPATGHGLNRVYAFKDESMRKLTYKWVMSLSAGVLIPEPLGTED